MESFKGIEIKRELRLCLVKGKPALFHMWEEHTDIIAPSPMVGGHAGGVLKYVMGIIETEDGRVEKAPPDSIQFVDQKIKEYCFEPEGSSQEDLEKQINYAVDLMYDLLNEYDIQDLIDIGHIKLASIWIDLNRCRITDEATIKACLRSFLIRSEGSSQEE